MAEFAYNSLVNRSTGLSPFEIVTGYRLKKPIDLPLHMMIGLVPELSHLHNIYMICMLTFIRK